MNVFPVARFVISSAAVTNFE